MQGYDEQNENDESMAWCVGAQRYFDLSQFEQSEILYSVTYDTYCVKYFCGKNVDCANCQNKEII